MGFFVLWRLRAWLPEQGLWKIPPVSKEQAGTCRSGGNHSQSQESCRAQAELLWVGLAPQGVTSAGHLAQFPCRRIAQRPMRWETLLVSVDAGKCVTAKQAPRGGEEPFPEGRTFQYPAALVSMEMAVRPKQEVGFLGEGRADPSVRTSHHQSLGYELLHLHQVPRYWDPI